MRVWWRETGGEGRRWNEKRKRGVMWWSEKGGVSVRVWWSEKGGGMRREGLGGKRRG